ncbi:11291_t:CDS:2 [Acaulospora morrowiae]|uniref:11291_t:CDS:1 n=1 Tax=Acaulospora morrowiae TaxID=94023 RepID=A0A9N9G1G2_9GLOM|nr:11291_t:CDS:2 [Acaulospora morrowiae]
MPRAKTQPKSTKKIRGQTCSRMQKLRLSNNFTGEKNGTNDNNLNVYLSDINNRNNPTNVATNHKNCDNCQESGNCIKILMERLSKIENIVDELSKITREFNASSINKIVPNKTQSPQYQGVNLSSCKLEELQKFVISATNKMTPNLKRKFAEESGDGIVPFSNLDSTRNSDNSSFINQHKIMSSDVDPKKIELRTPTSTLGSEPDKVNQSHPIKQEKQDHWCSGGEEPPINKRKRTFVEH